MYGYSEYRNLSQEDILSEVTQEEIFGLFIKSEIILDKMELYKAPYRDDNNPDCYFEYYDGILYFVDFADIYKSKNCFQFISRCINSKSLNTTYNYIYDKLNLGKGNTPKRENVVENNVVEVKRIKKERTISYAPRNFNYKDKKFWSKYNISSQNLIEDKVIPISAYRSTSRKGNIFTISTPDIMYAYTDFDNGRVKIYRPNGNKEEKWFTNCTQNDIGGINYLELSGDLLVITKSYKDYRVLKNQGIKNVIWFQNEGMLPNPTTIQMLGKRFSKIVVWFDNDQAGIDNCKLVVNYINSMFPGKARVLNLDISLLEEGIKDPSDLVANKGEEELIEFLKSKKLL